MRAKTCQNEKTSLFVSWLPAIKVKLRRESDEAAYELSSTSNHLSEVVKHCGFNSKIVSSFFLIFSLKKGKYGATFELLISGTKQFFLTRGDFRKNLCF